MPGIDIAIIANDKMKIAQFANSKKRGYPGPRIRKTSLSEQRGNSSTSISKPQQGQHCFAYLLLRSALLSPILVAY